ncbi:hypothetical protein ACGFIF_36830 [Kribbella sp. NPDC049174]|uniref:hypothetical protein n=1 Tax=Kribbella sp. NPDC049174 TaxID=3364112 RepID=UPI003710E98E
MTDLDPVAPLGAPPDRHTVEVGYPDDLEQPDIVEVWGKDSFPASDPPANW